MGDIVRDKHLSTDNYMHVRMYRLASIMFLYYSYTWFVGFVMGPFIGSLLEWLRSFVGFGGRPVRHPRSVPSSPNRKAQTINPKP